MRQAVRLADFHGGTKEAAEASADMSYATDLYPVFPDNYRRKVRVIENAEHFNRRRVQVSNVKRNPVLLVVNYERVRVWALTVENVVRVYAEIVPINFSDNPAVGTANSAGNENPLGSLLNRKEAFFTDLYEAKRRRGCMRGPVAEEDYRRAGRHVFAGVRWGRFVSWDKHTLQFWRGLHRGGCWRCLADRFRRCGVTHEVHGEHPNEHSPLGVFRLSGQLGGKV